MSDKIFFDGVEYASSIDAGREFGITNDRISQLCRAGQIRAKRVGQHWYVEREGLRNFILERDRIAAHRNEELARERAEEYRRLNAQKPSSSSRSASNPAHFSQKLFLQTSSLAVAILFTVGLLAGGDAAYSRLTSGSHFLPRGELAAAGGAAGSFFNWFKSLWGSSGNETDYIPTKWEKTTIQEKSVVTEKKPTTTPTSQRPTVVNNYPVVERIIERALPSYTIAQGGITEDILNKNLNELDNKLSSKIFSLSGANSTAIAQNYNVTAQTNKIDQLANVSISGASISGGSVSGASVSATTLSASGDTSLASTTVAGNLTVTGAFTGGSVSLTTSSSTNFIATNGTTTNATSTNFFSTNASTTNATSTTLFSTIGHFATAVIDAIADLVATNLIATNATTTNATTTNLAVSSLSQGWLFSDGTGPVHASTSPTVNYIVSTSTTGYNTFASRVGVGTTSPFSLFAIDAVHGGSVANTLFQISSSTAAFATTTHLTVLNTGQVGIGTSTPFSLLSVAGAGSFDGFLSANYFTATSTTASIFPYASSTALSVSGTGYFGTASTTALIVSNSPTALLQTSSTGVVSALTTSAALDTLITDDTGSGALVFDTSPTLVTPTLGVAAATSINKVTLTTPATGSTLTILDGKTLTANNTLTFAGTDSTTITFQGTDTYVGRATTDTLTNKTFDTAATGNSFSINGLAATANTGTGDVVRAASPTFTGTVNAAAATFSGAVSISVDPTAANSLDVTGNSTDTDGTTIVAQFSGAQSVAHAGTFMGLDSAPTYTAGADETLAAMNGIRSIPMNTGAGIVTFIRGVLSQPTNSGTGTTTGMQAFQALPLNSSGTTTTMYGVLSQTRASGGSVTTMRSLYADCGASGATAIVTTCTGLYIGTPVLTGTVTNNYAIWSDEGDVVIDSDGDGTIGGTTGGGLYLGEGQDLELYHDGTNSYIMNNTGDLYIGDAATDDVILSANAGKVGIGTTSPWRTLSVNGTVAFQGIGVNNTDNDLPLCWSSDTSEVRRSSAATTCQNSLDIAEHYGMEETVVRGEIVMLGTTVSSRELKVINPNTEAGESSETKFMMTAANVRKAVYTDRERLIGAVPTVPFLIDREATSTQAVALVGHVPVKMTLDGGDIAIGDPITVSILQSGWGMKATSTGRILGWALENFSATSTSVDGMIEVYVKPQDWIAPPDLGALAILSELLASSTAGTVAGFPLDNFFKNVFARVTQWLADASNGIEKIFTKELVAINVSADQVTTKKLCLEDVCVTKVELQALLSQQTAAVVSSSGASIPPASSSAGGDSGSSGDSASSLGQSPTGEATPASTETIPPTEAATSTEPTVLDESTDDAPATSDSSTPTSTDSIAAEAGSGAPTNPEVVATTEEPAVDTETASPPTP